MNYGKKSLSGTSWDYVDKANVVGNDIMSCPLGAVTPLVLSMLVGTGGSWTTAVVLGRGEVNEREWVVFLGVTLGAPPCLGVGGRKTPVSPSSVGEGWRPSDRKLFLDIIPGHSVGLADVGG